MSEPMHFASKRMNKRGFDKFDIDVFDTPKASLNYALAIFG